MLVLEVHHQHCTEAQTIQSYWISGIQKVPWIGPTTVDMCTLLELGQLITIIINHWVICPSTRSVVGNYLWEISVSLHEATLHSLYKLSKLSRWEIHNLGSNEPERPIQCHHRKHFFFHLKVYTRALANNSLEGLDWKLMMWDPPFPPHGGMETLWRLLRLVRTGINPYYHQAGSFLMSHLPDNSLKWMSPRLSFPVKKVCKSFVAESGAGGCIKISKQNWSNFDKLNLIQTLMLITSN